MHVDWTTTSVVVGTISGTITAMSAAGHGLTWISGKVAAKFTDVVNDKVGAYLATIEDKMADRVVAAIASKDRVSVLAAALAEDDTFRATVKQSIAGTCPVVDVRGKRPHVANGHAAATAEAAGD